MDTELFRAPVELVTALGFAMPRFLGVFTILPLLSRETLPEQRRAMAKGLPGMPVPDLTAGGKVTLRCTLGRIRSTAVWHEA